MSLVSCSTTKQTDLEKYVEKISKLTVSAQASVIAEDSGKTFNKSILKQLGYINGEWPTSSFGNSLHMTYKIESINEGRSGDLIFDSKLNGESVQGKVKVYVASTSNINSVYQYASKVANLYVESLAPIAASLEPKKFEPKDLINYGQVFGRIPIEKNDFEITFTIPEKIDIKESGFMDVKIVYEHAIVDSSIRIWVLDKDEEQITEIANQLSAMYIYSTKDVPQDFDIHDITFDFLKSYGDVYGNFPTNLNGVSMTGFIFIPATKDKNGSLLITITKNNARTLASIVIHVI